MKCFACGTEKANAATPIEHSRFFDEVLCIDCWEEAWSLRFPGTIYVSREHDKRDD